MGGPATARVTANNDKRVTIKWTIEGVDRANAANVEQLRFSGTYLR